MNHGVHLIGKALCFITLLAGCTSSFQALDLNSGKTASSLVSDSVQAAYAPGQLTLTAGQSVSFQDLILVMQSDGNLVLSRGSEPLWGANEMIGFQGLSSDCSACLAVFQGDGNLVLYHGDGTSYWNSGTAGSRDATLVIAAEEPRVSVRSGSGNLLFSSFTSRNSLSPGIAGKFMVGYQGWFSAQGDGDAYTTATNSWSHWSQWDTGAPTFTNPTVDMWPDMSEYSQLYPTGMTYQNGTNARVFSSYDSSTVATHFRWMQQYGIDGAVLQRFSSHQRPGYDSRYMDFTSQVAKNVRQAAEATGRTFCILIDTAEETPENVVQDVINEWNQDVRQLRLTESAHYLRENGHPVVYLAAFGSVARNSPNPDQAAQIIAFFKNQGVVVVGETPAHWRTLDLDSQADPRWLGVYHSYDVINPWTVGIYSTDDDVDHYVNNIVFADMQDAVKHGQRYMPTIFPGFSRSNLCSLPDRHCEGGISFNAVPRRGGTFWWRQAIQYKRLGVNMLYGAMFDEIDEGTAIMKLAPTQGQTPAQVPYVSLDADGYGLPSDWYLQLASLTARLLHGDLGITQQIPLSMPGRVPAPTDPNAQMLYLRGSLNLRENQSIQRDGFVLYMQDDGNLVLKEPSGHDLWSSGTSGLCMAGSTPQACLLTYQGSDGNLVIYNLVTGASQSLGGLGSWALLINRESNNPLLFE